MHRRAFTMCTLLCAPLIALATAGDMPRPADASDKFFAGPIAKFSITLDDGAPVERAARSVVVGNSGLLPGGFSLLPDARLDDGILDVGVLAPHGPFGWTRLATRVLTHSHHQDRMLERFQARKVEITTLSLLPREIDGELVTAGHSLTVTVQPSALTVRMPRL